jgi:hypothetical protein
VWALNRARALSRARGWVAAAEERVVTSGARAEA